MPDSRFFKSNPPISIEKSLGLAGAIARGDVPAQKFIARAARVGDGDADDAVIFIDCVDHIQSVRGASFALCLASKDVAERLPLATGAIGVTENPRVSFAALAAALHELRSFADFDAPPPRISPSATIHPTAIIGGGAEIGDAAVIGPNVVIGPGVAIGCRTIVGSGASVWCAIIGGDSVIGPGCVIGEPGFGFANGEAGLTRVPQLGRVILGERVEIGANVCIDRGTLDDTIVGRGVKIDNLVQIAHNVRIGENCVIAAQVGIAGSAVVGDGVQFGGQAGIADHIRIGDGARVAAKAGVMRDIPPKETWGGYPARPMMTWMRETAAAARAARRGKKASCDDD